VQTSANTYVDLVVSTLANPPSLVPHLVYEGKGQSGASFDAAQAQAFGYCQSHFVAGQGGWMMVGKGRQVKFWRFVKDGTAYESKAVQRHPLPGAGLRINEASSASVALDIVNDEGLIHEWLGYMSSHL
jgi:hypothetical protein